MQQYFAESHWQHLRTKFSRAFRVKNQFFFISGFVLTRFVTTHPLLCTTHTGLQCFEGMKAYRSTQDHDSVHLFRPDKNMEVSEALLPFLDLCDRDSPLLSTISLSSKHCCNLYLFFAKRLTNSMRRLEMPGSDFDNNELIKLIGELVKTDKDWIPYGEGYSLYLRPTVIATHSVLGLAAPEKILLYVICSPVGPYYKTGFDPIKLTADTKFVRAWPGGTGKST